jgi:hypothetical protein
VIDQGLAEFEDAVAALDTSQGAIRAGVHVLADEFQA